MLDLMRKHAGTWMIKALLGAIVVVFVFWGVGSWTGNKESRVATVNGETISIEDYRNAYNRMVDQARQNFGASLSDELIKTMQLSRQAMDQLIDRALLRQAASRLNLQVGDEELARSVRGIDAFKDGGAFSRRRYEQLLSLNRLTPEQFEAGQRDSLLVEKLMRLVTEGVKVSDMETEEYYKWNNSAVKLDYVLFPTDKYTGTSASAEEIQQYFDRRKDDYQTEPEIQVRYAHVKLDGYMDKVTVAPEEIQAYYESNTERFVVPPTVEARHILIKAAAEAGEAADRQARDKIQEILGLARQGKDFGELAQQFSEDATKDRGGALGAFRKEAMVKPFADAAFALKPGEISEPVRTQFGWHLIKVEKFTEGHTRGLEEARAEIEKQLKGERARALAYDEAEAIYDAASGAGDLVGATSARKLNLLTTGFFTRRGPVKGVSQGAKFSQAAFQLSAGEVSDILDFGDGYYLLQIAETRPARVPELTAVQDRVKADVIREKQVEQSLKDAGAILAELKNGVALDQAAQKFGVAAKTSELLKREESIPALGSEPEVMRTAFSLTEREPLPKEAIRTPKGFCVIRLNARQLPSPEGFEKEKAPISDRLLQQKKMTAWQAWLEQLRKQAEIVRRKDFLEG